MYKRSKKAAVALLTVGLITGAALTFTNLKADEVYDDSSIGISSALDRYVESVQTETDKLNENLADNKEEETTKVTKKKSSKKKNKKTDAKEEETCKYPQFQDKCLATVTDSVNIRTEANETSEIVGTLPVNGIASVIEKGKEWTQVESGSCKGYIKNEFLVYGDDAGAYAEEHCAKIATVMADSLNVRSMADAESDCVTMIAEGESYVVVDTVTGWVGIAIDAETYGYVSADYVDVTFSVNNAVSVEEAEAIRAAEEAAEEEERLRQEAEAQQQTENEDPTEPQYEPETPTETPTEAPTEAPTETPTEAPTTEEPANVPSSGSTGVDLANFALQYVGNPYVYGGSSLTDGADCSGFVMAVYAEFGYSLPHSAGMQSGYGTEVSTSELEPGDLLFYGSYSIEHVAIYVGNGMIVHASTPESGIKTSNYNYRTPCKAVRILGQ